MSEKSEHKVSVEFVTNFLNQHEIELNSDELDLITQKVERLAEKFNIVLKDFSKKSNRKSLKKHFLRKHHNSSR